MLTINRLFLALAFLGGSAAAQASDGNSDAARVDLTRNKKLAGIMMASAAKLSDATPAMSGAYASRSSSLSQGSDNYLPVHHRL